MKKKIKDLKIDDSVYVAYHNQVEKINVISISKKEIEFHNGYYTKLESGDQTRFKFKVGYSSLNFECFLSEIDAQKLLLERRKKALEELFLKQKDFLSQVQKATDELRETDLKIIELLKKEGLSYE